MLVVGAASRDVARHDPRGWRLGGTVAYAALTAARLGVAVRAVVGVDARSAGAHELDLLRAADVDVRLVELDRGPVFENLQTPAGRVQRSEGPSDPMPAAALPDEWRGTAAVLLGPVAGELRDEWAAALPRGAFVALAWQGLLRRLVNGAQVKPLPISRGDLVRRADALFVSAEDIAPRGVPLSDVIRDGQQLVITHGARGSIQLRRADGRFSGSAAPAVPGPEVVDSTGAGDVFLAAWLSARLLARHAAEDKYLLVASAMAGLSVAAPSLAALPGRRDLCAALLRRRDGRHG